MPLRRLLNLSYAVLTEGMEKSDRESMDQLLLEKFEHEMTPREQKKAEAYRRALGTGAVQGQKRAIELMQQGARR